MVICDLAIFLSSPLLFPLAHFSFKFSLENKTVVPESSILFFFLSSENHFFFVLLRHFQLNTSTLTVKSWAHSIQSLLPHFHSQKQNHTNWKKRKKIIEKLDKWRAISWRSPEKTTVRCFYTTTKPNPTTFPPIFLVPLSISPDLIPQVTTFFPLGFGSTFYC